jgi:FkbM family methyltransferase
VYNFCKTGIRAILGRFGFDLVRTRTLSTAGRRRAAMLRHHGIQTVLDVGANIGRYGEELREWGFEGRILSFEPTTEAFEQLQRRAQDDRGWSVFQCALGAEDGVAEINVASNHCASSSLLPMLDAHKRTAPDVQVVSTERVKVKTLDSVPAGLVAPDEKLLLKMDTQGFEPAVLRGAQATLAQVQLIECELSFVPLYGGQLLFPQMLELLAGLGFHPVQFAPGFADPRSGHCLQVDGTFARLS